VALGLGGDYCPRLAGSTPTSKGKPGLGLIAGYLFAAPYEEIKLKGR
jgi:hypothetical protein